MSKAYQEGITIPEFAVTGIEGLSEGMSVHGEPRHGRDSRMGKHPFNMA